MQSFLTWLELFLSLALIVAVLVHPAKGMGLGSMGGSAQLFGSQKGAETGLNRITGAIIFLWLGTAIVLSSNFLGQPVPDQAAPLPTQQTPIQLPGQTAPQTPNQAAPKAPEQKASESQSPAQQAPSQPASDQKASPAAKTN